MKKRILVCMLLPLLFLTGCTSFGGTQEKKTVEWIQEADKVQFEKMCVDALNETIKSYPRLTFTLDTLKKQSSKPIQVKESSCRAYYNDELKDTIVIGARSIFQFEEAPESSANIWQTDYFNRVNYEYTVHSISDPSSPSKTMYTNNDDVTAVFKKENGQYKLEKLVENTEVENSYYQLYKKTAEQGKKIDVPIQSLIEKAVK